EGMESDEDDHDRFIYRKEPKEIIAVTETAKEEIIEVAKEDGICLKDEDEDLEHTEVATAEEEISAPVNLKVEEVSLEQLDELEQETDDENDENSVGRKPKRSSKRKAEELEPDEETEELEEDEENIH
ncbi:MAG: hypothetical protein MUP57_03870, partial [Clostridia bacterium]|nr:hypothetical protein [Clostridia bacterium]